MSNYWQICVEEGLSECGIAATDEQVKALTKWVQNAHDMYGEAHGHEHIPNPLREEIKGLTKALQIERDMIFCRECNGIGRIISHGPYHSSDSQCWKCNGKGKHLP